MLLRSGVAITHHGCRKASKRCWATLQAQERGQQGLRFRLVIDQPRADGGAKNALAPPASFLIHRRTLRKTGGLTSTVFSYGTLSLPRKSNLMVLGSMHSTFSTCDARLRSMAIQRFARLTCGTNKIHILHLQTFAAASLKLAAQCIRRIVTRTSSSVARWRRHTRGRC